MRSGKSLVVLVAVLGGLLAYLYFVDAGKPVTPEGEEARDKAFTVEAEKIGELRVKSSSGESAALKKEKDTWQMVEPVAAKVDQSEASGITSNLASAEIQAVVDESPSSLQPYGLDQPRVEIAFKAAGDKDFQRLRIGGKTPTGGDLYAQRGDSKRVFLIPAYLESSFDRKPFDLRDKGILAFERDKVDRLELAHGGTSVSLVKGELDWNIVAPIQSRADFSAVEGLVTRLQSAQMKSMVEENATDLKKYGLDAPTLSATVGAGSARATLAFGSTADGGDVHARDVSRPVVVTVAADLASDLKKTAGDLRRKDLFAFRSFNATRVEVTRGAETIALEKVKGTGENAADKWRRVSPTVADLDTAKVESFLSALSGLRAQSFADAKTPTGLAQPIATVTASFNEGKQQERVRFGRAGSDVFAVAGDEPGAARMDAAAYDEAMKALDALK